MNIEVGQGISCICTGNGQVERKYGLVVDVDNGGIYVCLVSGIYNENGCRTVYCYDEPGAASEHRHYVRLKNSDCVFTGVNCIIDAKNITHIHNAYVDADFANRRYIDMDDFMKLGICVIDDGSKISNADWDEVMHYLSVSQPQKEKSVGRVAAAEALLKNIHSDFDKDDGYQRG